MRGRTPETCLSAARFSAVPLVTHVRHQLSHSEPFGSEHI